MWVITELCLDLDQRKWAGSDGKLWLMVQAFVRDCDTMDHVSDCSYEFFCSSIWNVMLWTAFLLGSQVSVSKGAAKHIHIQYRSLYATVWMNFWSCDATCCLRPSARQHFNRHHCLSMFMSRSIQTVKIHICEAVTSLNSQVLTWSYTHTSVRTYLTHCMSLFLKIILQNHGSKTMFDSHWFIFIEFLFIAFVRFK